MAAIKNTPTLVSVALLFNCCPHRCSMAVKCTTPLCLGGSMLVKCTLPRIGGQGQRYLLPTPLPPITNISGHCSEMYTSPPPALAVSVSLPASLSVSRMPSGWDYTGSVGWRSHLPEIVPVFQCQVLPFCKVLVSWVLRDGHYVRGNIIPGLSRKIRDT